jgi:hypothetical protein
MVRTQTCQSGRYGVSVGGGPTICIGYLPWRLRSRNHPTCNSRASSPYPRTLAFVRRECTARCHLRRSVSTWRHGAWHVCVPQGRSRSRQTMHCLPVGPTCSQPTVILYRNARPRQQQRGIAYHNMHNFVLHRGEGFVEQLYSESGHCCTVRAGVFHVLIVITASHKLRINRSSPATRRISLGIIREAQRGIILSVLIGSIDTHGPTPGPAAGTQCPWPARSHTKSWVPLVAPLHAGY